MHNGMKQERKERKKNRLIKNQPKSLLYLKRPYGIPSGVLFSIIVCLWLPMILEVCAGELAIVSSRTVA